MSENVLSSVTVPKNSGRASTVLKRGSAFEWPGGRWWISLPSTCTISPSVSIRPGPRPIRRKIFISTGDQLVVEAQQSAMLTIVADTFPEGRHDLQKGMCSRKRFELVAAGLAQRNFIEGVDPNPKKPEDIPTHGCYENLSEAVRPWDIAPVDIPSPFNIFQTMRIDPDTGAMFDTFVRPKEEAHVDFRAEMDCLVALSACPESGRGQADPGGHISNRRDR